MEANMSPCKPKKVDTAKVADKPKEEPCCTTPADPCCETSEPVKPVAVEDKSKKKGCGCGCEKK
jgi:hypothetical protein